MAISRITTQDATGTGSTNASASYAAKPTANNLLIAATYCNDGPITISNAGWTLAVQVNDSGFAKTTAIYYKVAGINEPTTITTSTDGAAVVVLLAVYEYRGFSGKPTLDRTSTSQSTALTIPCGTTATTNTANELLFAVGEIAAVNAITSWSGSFTARNTVATTNTMFTADQVVAAVGAYTTTATTTGTSTLNSGAIATFYASPQNSLNNYQFVKVGDGMSASERIR